MASKDDVQCWVEHFLNKYNYKNYTIEFTGGPSKDSGYMSDVMFITVNCVNKHKQPKSLHLVLKHNALQQDIFITTAFQIERIMYDSILPTLKQFEISKHIIDVFNSVPKYFDSFLVDTTQIILIENVTKLGYKMYDRRKCFDYNHCKLVLEEYGKLHALSFAFRDQQPEEFQKCVNSIPDIYATMRVLPDMLQLVEDRVNQLLKVLKENGDENLYQKLQKIKFEDGTDFSILKEKQTVICHADNWNNNYMFKYSDDSSLPTSVVLLDWQISGVRSPVNDLSTFLFLTCSKEELDQLEIFLNIYYNSFKDRLTRLGSSEDLFTYADLKRHWKDYSKRGLLNMIIDLNLAVKEDINSDMKETEDELYYQRAKASLSSYFKYQKIFSSQ